MSVLFLCGEHNVLRCIIDNDREFRHLPEEEDAGELSYRRAHNINNASLRALLPY